MNQVPQYTITVEKMEPVTTLERGEYKHLRYEYISVEEYNKLEHGDKRAWKYIATDSSEHPGQYERGVYGYLNDVETPGTKKTKVFEQVVETLDVSKIILAINNK